MDSKIREIAPLVAENWLRQDPSLQDVTLVRPVQKGDKGSETKSTGDDGTRKQQSEAPLSSEQTKSLTEEIGRYLKDFNIQLDYSVEKKTGDLVVRVKDRDTGDVIRQIPPEALVKLREKLKELRGVLFDDKV